MTFNLNQQHVGSETGKAWLLDVMTISIGCLRQEHYMLLNFPIFTVAWKPLLGEGAPVWNLKSKKNIKFNILDILFLSFTAALIS